MVELKTPGEIKAMRAAGQVVAQALSAVRDNAAVGTRLGELDEVARSVLKEAGATSPFLGYQPGFAPTPFPAVICTSVNDVALHGIPGDYRLADGDLISVDCGAVLDGWAGDSAISFTIGHARETDLRLIDTAQTALAAGIAAAVVGGKIGNISAAKVPRASFALSRGRRSRWRSRSRRRARLLRSVPNEGRAGRGLRLRPGLVIAIEPWFLAGGSDRYRIDRDGWTLRSTDGSRAAHVEHTVAITEEGPLILTAA